MPIFAFILALGAPQECVFELVERLDGESIEDRERAMVDLLDCGVDAEVALGSALSSRQVETRWRAREVLKTMERYREEVAGRMIHLLSHADRKFHQGRFEEARRYCSKLLLIDPHYDNALTLAATISQILNDRGDPGGGFVLDWEADIRLPRFSSWPDLRRDTTGPGCEGSCRTQVAFRLETLRFDFAFEDAMRGDVLDFIRDFSGVKIDARPLRGYYSAQRITVRATGVTLGTLLRLLLEPIDMSYTVTEKGVSVYDALRDPDRY